jgi:hypothetical protein
MIRNDGISVCPGRGIRLFPFTGALLQDLAKLSRSERSLYGRTRYKDTRTSSEGYALIELVDFGQDRHSLQLPRDPVVTNNYSSRIAVWRGETDEYRGRVKLVFGFDAIYSTRDLSPL